MALCLDFSSALLALLQTAQYFWIAAALRAKQYHLPKALFHLNLQLASNNNRPPCLRIIKTLSYYFVKLLKNYFDTYVGKVQNLQPNIQVKWCTINESFFEVLTFSLCCMILSFSGSHQLQFDSQRSQLSVERLDRPREVGGPRLHPVWWRLGQGSFLAHWH